MEGIFTPGDDPTGPGGKKKFYKFIKHNKADFNGLAALKVDGKLVSDRKRKADALNRHFESVLLFPQKTTTTIIESKSPYPTIHCLQSHLLQLPFQGY